MSRSYKKHPYCTDGRSPTPRQMKSIANRSVRQRNKRVVQGWFEDDLRYMNELTLDGKSYKKWYCSYDIHDWVSRWSKAEALSEYEHPHWRYLKHYDGTGEWWHAWVDYNEKQFLNHWAKYYRRK